jgi:hypothetical protein
MVRSYVGIISRRGLELLLPETEHAVPFLLRRAYCRHSAGAICCWAVMQDAAAGEVQRQLLFRRYEDAFLSLRVKAACFGTILPPSADVSA